MDFEYSDEQMLLKQTVKEFAEREILPHRHEWDEQQVYPRHIMEKLGELGMMGSIFPPEYGGAGLNYVDYVILIEELSRVDGSIGISIAAHTSLASNHIYMAGTDDQKSKYLTKLASGQWIGAWSLTEPEAGSDAGGTRTKAVKTNDGWVLNGQKTFTTHGSVGDLYVLMARTNPEKGHHGISAFIIEKTNPGLVVGKKENKVGLRASDTASVILDDCYVGEDSLLGKEGEAFVDSMRILDGGRISIAALALGIAQGAYETALQYAKERKQFGQTISSFQAIQWKLADMATQIEAARLLTLQAAWLKDQGKRVTKLSAMAKLYASEVAVNVSEEAVQIHGGYGYTKDYPAEKYWRDSKLCTIGEGTSEIQRLVIARQLLKGY